MRKLILTGCLVIAGCSKAPDATPDLTGNATAGVAFAYGYSFELPSRSVADLQEAHAQACEQAGVGACRITGLSYAVDRDGEARASLSVKVAARVARRFGRTAVAAGDRFGATLIGAEITGEEVTSAITEAGSAQRDAKTDIDSIGRSLANPQLPGVERAELRQQRAARIEAARAGTTTAASQAERLANTPMTFAYEPGHGVGFGNALRDSADTALSSTRTTLIGATWLLATFGPPAVLLLVGWLAWRRWGRRLWLKALGDHPAIA